MSEDGARIYVREMLAQIYSAEAWARAMHYVVLHRARNTSWVDIASLLTLDNPFNVMFVNREQGA